MAPRVPIVRLEITSGPTKSFPSKGPQNLQPLRRRLRVDEHLFALFRNFYIGKQLCPRQPGRQFRREIFLGPHIGSNNPDPLALLGARNQRSRKRLRLTRHRVKGDVFDGGARAKIASLDFFTILDRQSSSISRWQHAAFDHRHRHHTQTAIGQKTLPGIGHIFQRQQRFFNRNARLQPMPHRPIPSPMDWAGVKIRPSVTRKTLAMAAPMSAPCE